MAITTIKHRIALAAIIVFTYLTVMSLCHSQPSVEVNQNRQNIARIISDFQSDTIKGTPDEKIIKANSDPANKNDQIESIDSTKFNVFGDLLNDDPVYNKRQPLWVPILEVPLFNIGLWAVNRYAMNADYARVNPTTWSRNIKTGWEWDGDRFGMNFLAHPYSGGIQFTNARACGYTFFESMPFAFAGSLMWEYFGEKTLPSYNDIINTPISGAFYGEILYRLGSNILDDRTTGAERVFRELGAAVLSPTRFMNRLIQGKLTSLTHKEVYQKEPLNVEISVGARKANDEGMFWTGPSNIFVNAQLDYGYALEKREWKPFDYFQIRAGVNFGIGRKLIEMITGYGILYGKNVKSGDLEMVMGIFQHYNYYDNKTFELGTIGFGGGIMSKYPIAKETFLFTNLHLAIVPLAGNSTRFGPDTSQLRDYNYGGGLQSKLESGLNLSWGSIQFIGNFYWIHNYNVVASHDGVGQHVGAKGDNFIAIIKPRITIKLYQNVHIGFEQMLYSSSRYTDFGTFLSTATEQRFYLMINVGNFKL